MAYKCFDKKKFPQNISQTKNQLTNYKNKLLKDLIKEKYNHLL